MSSSPRRSSGELVRAAEFHQHAVTRHVVGLQGFDVLEHGDRLVELPGRQVGFGDAMRAIAW